MATYHFKIVLHSTYSNVFRITQIKLYFILKAKEDTIVLYTRGY